MRHARMTQRLGRSPAGRRALVRSLVKSLLEHEQVRTTSGRARAAEGLAEHLIELGKQDTLAHRRQVYAVVQNHTLVNRLFGEISPRFATRRGGYTRVVKLAVRNGDRASMVVWELVERAPSKRAAKGPRQRAERSEKARAPASPREGKDVVTQAPTSPGEPGEKHPRDKKEKPTGFLKGLRRFLGGKRAEE